MPSPKARVGDGGADAFIEFRVIRHFFLQLKENLPFYHVSAWRLMTIFNLDSLFSCIFSAP
jgi:hypothetical protein